MKTVPGFCEKNYPRVSKKRCPWFQFLKLSVLLSRWGLEPKQNHDVVCSVPAIDFWLTHTWQERIHRPGKGGRGWGSSNPYPHPQPWAVVAVEKVWTEGFPRIPGQWHQVECSPAPFFLLWFSGFLHFPTPSSGWRYTVEHSNTPSSPPPQPPIFPVLLKPRDCPFWAKTQTRFSASSRNKAINLFYKRKTKISKEKPNTRESIVHSTLNQILGTLE